MNKNKVRKPKAIDIFSGCGGTTQGLKDAGFQVVAAIEKDPLSAATYRNNHNRTMVWERDIREIDATELLSHLGLRRAQLDLLVGCPPCQAFSAMRSLNGKRRIHDRPNKDLVFEFLRFVEELKPSVVMLENVPRMMEDYRFKGVQRQLRTLGYTGQPRVVDAATFGVPQRRKRMLYIGSRIGDIGYAKSNDASLKVTVRNAIGHLTPPGLSGDELHDIPENRSDRVKRLIAKVPKNGGSRRSLGHKGQLMCHRKCDGFTDVYGRMAWDDVSPTITSGCVNPSKGRFLHPHENRTITLREAALLQSFPGDYFFSLQKGKFAAAAMIGNAFPPRPNGCMSGL